MKKLFTILLGFLFPLCVIGQQPFKREVAIGVSYGMGASSVSFTPRIQTNQLMGSHFGITARWMTEKHLGLLLEVNYTQQGWDEKFEDLNNPGLKLDYKYTHRINVIEIPFMTHIYFGNERFRFFFNLGPKIGFVQGESIDENVIGREGELPSPNNGGSYTILREKPLDNKFAWGLCGGPGLELRTKAGIFQLEGRYSYGLGDFFSNRLGADFGQSSSQVMLGKFTWLLPVYRK